jgi:TPR repeat protein/transglutaminase-like putative cysteine protease
MSCNHPFPRQYSLFVQKRPQWLALVALILTFNLAQGAPVQKPADVMRTGASAFSRNPALPKWADPLEPVAAPNTEEPVVIRLAETQYWTGANPAYLVNRATQVNASSRLSEIGQFSIGFIPAYQKLIVHRVAILRGNEVLDRSKTANIRVLDNENNAAGGYYLGESKAQLLLEDVKAGDTLWITYSVEGTNPVFGSTWNETLPWPKEAPIELRKVSVLQPAGHQVQWRVSGDPQAELPKPKVEQRNGITRLVFQQNAVPAVEYEPAIPPNLIPVPVLDLSEYKNWNQVAQWASALFSGTTPGAEVQALARKFTGESLEERASQALHWVQDDIRYFSASMGENSHRPQPPEVVLKRRFGDCKDKSQLLVALYHAMGIEAQPVLLHASAPKIPEQFLPSPGNFNHAIVRVMLNGKPYFVDPTLANERGLISALPVPVPAAAALIVSNDSTGLITLPEDTFDQPLVDRNEQLSLESLHGDAQLKLRIVYRGRFAAGMRQGYRSMSSFDLKKAILAQYERTYPGVKLDGAPALTDGDGGTSFIVDAQLNIPKALKEKNGMLYLPQRSHIMEGTLGIPDKLVRKYPFRLAAGRYRASYTLDASLPSEARLVKEDDKLALHTKYFDARAQLTWRGAHLSYFIDYAINQPEVEAAELPGLADEIRKLNPMFESDLRFTPLTVTPQAAKEASLRVLDILQKLSVHEDALLAALASGKKPEVKLDEAAYAKMNYRALCEMVVDGSSVSEWNPMIGMAIEPYYKIVDERADQRTKDLCGARLLLIKHDLINASKELARLQPDDSDPLTIVQAWADFHSGAPAQARANLLRFLKAKSAADSLSADDGMLALALSRRLGMAEPAELARLSSELRQDAWPMPLFKRLRGQLTDAELQAIVDALPPAAREYAALEAHFAISQAHLSNSERRMADQPLNWLRRYSLPGSLFEVLATRDKFSEEYADADMREVWKIEGKKGAPSDIVRHLTAAAERGITSAQRVLGWRYVYGEDVDANPAKGVSLLEAAAAKGDPDAMNTLGRVYALGKLGQRDGMRAVSYYRQAAENGDHHAAYNLGKAYWFGDLGLPVDLDQSFRYMRDAAEMRNSSAEFYLSRMYFEGKGTTKNDSLAMFWASQGYFQKDWDDKAQLGLLLVKLRKDEPGRAAGTKMLLDAAVAGNGYAKLEYSKLLLNTSKRESDLQAAFTWVKQAADNGNESAQALLGRMYVEGLGVKVDVPRGLELLAKQEKEKLPDAFNELGKLYRNEKSGVTDKAKAAEYFRQGAALGQREAAQALAMMLHTGDGIPRDLPQAIQYYELAIKSGYLDSMNNLAEIYRQGEDGIPRNIDRAVSLLRSAAQMGHTFAMVNLGNYYENNPAADKPEFLPLAYYLLASKYGESEATVGLARVKAKAPPEVLAAAQTFVTKWSPGQAMPEES